MTTTTGIITCSSIAEQVKNALKPHQNYRLYQLVPSCMFTVSPELIRHVFEQACLENDHTLLVYGFCHSEMGRILKSYSDKIMKVEGDNCWEMLLGRDQAREYVSDGYWLLKNALCTNWKNEVFVSYGAFSPNGNMIKACGTKQILACRFESDKPYESDVSAFASAFDVPYKITQVDLTGFRSLISRSIDKLKNNGRFERRCNQKAGITGPAFTGQHEKEVYYKTNMLTKDITFVSPKIQRLLGYTADEFIQLFLAGPAKGFYKDHDVYQNVTESRYSYISRCLAEGIQLPYSIEYEARKKNGSIIWIRESLFPKYYKDGSIQPNLIGKFEDITEWKSKEEELKQALTKEAELRSKLEKEIKSRIHFTNALVHELKTPLTPIILASDTLANVVKDSEYRLLLEQIKVGANEMCLRIDELLDLARGEVGLLTLDREELDLNELIDEVVSFLAPKAVNNRQIIKCDMDRGIPYISADRRRIKEVLTNLIDNAIKYSGVESRISLTTELKDTTVIITVSDTGKGIPKAEQKTIFDPYKHSPRERLSGLGLGLALSKMIIEKHGGCIELNSRIKRGCSFKISIPVEY